MDAIRAERLSKVFQRGRVRALQNVTIHVSGGRIFGLLGPNGAGKTTFVKILLGLLRPSAGNAFLFDYPVRQAQARLRVGYLPENHRFPAYLTGGDFLQYCARLSQMRDPALRRKRAEELLKRLDMWEWRNTRIKKYSKGMLQRLGMAQALIHDPDLIFLDEPTDGVDPIGRREIRDLLLELKARGKTIFLNSHLLSEVETVCDEVAILNHGKVIVQGTVQELTTLDRRYEIIADFVDATWLQNLHGTVKLLHQDGDRATLAVPDVEALNRLIDELRARGILIRAVRPLRQSLEDSFIQAVQKDGEVDFNLREFPNGGEGD